MVSAILKILAGLIELLPKALDAARAWNATRTQTAKDTRNDAAIAEAQKGLDRPKP